MDISSDISLFRKKRGIMLSETIYETLLDMLTKGELMPGEIINRREIASRLGVSVAPVLEAMLKLEMEGYIETIPRKGTQVRIIRQEDVLGNLLIKTGIECMAVRNYCGEKIRSNYDELMTLAVDLEESFSKFGSSTEVWRKDMAFHTELVSLCENPVLSEHYAAVTKPSLFYHLNCTFLRYSISERSNHIKLLEALRTDDKNEAEAILREHLFSDKEIMSDYL